MPKKSQNPMQFRVRSASGDIRRSFRKRESAEKYFEEAQIDFPSEVIIFEDVIASTIISSYYPKENVPTATSGYISTDTNNEVGFTITTIPPKNVIYEYKDGSLIRKEVNGKSRKTVKGFFKSLFKRGNNEKD